MIIEQQFLESLKNYESESESNLMLWKEVEKNYSASNRYYHTLTHLNSLVDELIIYKDKFTNWDTIVFAIAYHDIIYNTLKNNNEERSAALAVKRLGSTSFPKKQLAYCAQLILATKQHEHDEEEINLFTDADLSILGSDSETYKLYAKHIRQEYWAYPNFAYNPGRRKVLTHFLKMESIYKTKEFADRYEQTARANLLAELNSLTKTK